MNDDGVEILNDSKVAALADELAERAQSMDERRLIIGIAGIAGSGKSTLAARLAGKIDHAVVFGMDGFHLRNDDLKARGIYELKGAPQTFDARSFIDTLRAFHDRSHIGHYPVYDREASHEPVMSAEPITNDTRLIIAEGLFLLLRDEPWCELADVLDETWRIEATLEHARDWIIHRHTSTGRTMEQALKKYENDQRNSMIVIERSREADRLYRWDTF